MDSCLVLEFIMIKKIVIQGEEFLIDGKHLGTGMQGSVFQILHLGSGIVYAVKIVKMEDKAAVETIQHEINILKNIRSPYVISILPFSIVSERFSYMVMDYCEGGDLKQHYKRLMLSKVPIDEKRVKKLIYDCAQGYKTLEANNVLHMDIKMQNILVKKGKYALADFGLAVNKQTTPKKVGGTLLYFSLARFTKKANQVNSLDDMFAFGVVVCEFSNKLYHPYYTAKMFAQKTEQKSMSTMEFLWRNLKQAKPTASETYSEPLRTLIMRMIAKQEKDRISWKELYEVVDAGELFADTRAEADLTHVKVVMPELINSGSLMPFKDIRTSNVNTNLMNSQFSLEETKQIDKIYVEIKKLIQHKLKVCGFIAHLIDIIEVYHFRSKTTTFRKIQESLLTVMEQLVQLENVKELDIPEMENPPERIEIQIAKIYEEFQKILGVKNKVNCFRDHLKIEHLFNTITSTLESQVLQFEEKAKGVFQQIQIIAGIKQIQEDFTLNSAIFKLILYLIDKTKSILNEKKSQKQNELIPKIQSINLQSKDYGDKSLQKSVSEYLQKEGFIITFVEDCGFHEILDQSDDEPQLVQLNVMGKYPPLY